MSLMYDLLKTDSCRIVSFNGTGLGTSAVLVTDHEGNPISYPCRGLRLFNTNIDKSVYYSFDNSKWLTVPPLGVMEEPKKFNTLYVKASAAGATYEGDVAKFQ